jgi:hypothetical protein
MKEKTGATLWEVVETTHFAEFSEALADQFGAT